MSQARPLLRRSRCDEKVDLPWGCFWERVVTAPGIVHAAIDVKQDVNRPIVENLFGRGLPPTVCSTSALVPVSKPASTVRFGMRRVYFRRLLPTGRCNTGGYSSASLCYAAPCSRTSRSPSGDSEVTAFGCSHGRGGGGLSGHIEPSIEIRSATAQRVQMPLPRAWFSVRVSFLHSDHLAVQNRLSQSSVCAGLERRDCLLCATWGSDLTRAVGVSRATLLAQVCAATAASVR